MNAAHVSHHAIHGHIARHHRFQGPVFFYRYRKSYHQFSGSGVHVRRGHHRSVLADHLLIPGANGRVIIRRHARRLREFRRFSGIAHIDVGEASRLGELFKDRYRVVTQRHALGGGNDRHFAFHPVGNRHVMAGAGAGQNVTLRLLIILARDLEINDGIEKKGDDQAACRRGNDASTNRSEHK